MGAVDEALEQRGRAHVGTENPSSLFVEPEELPRVSILDSDLGTHLLERADPGRQAVCTLPDTPISDTHRAKDALTVHLGDQTVQL